MFLRRGEDRPRWKFAAQLSIFGERTWYYRHMSALVLKKVTRLEEMDSSIKILYQRMLPADWNGNVDSYGTFSLEDWNS